MIDLSGVARHLRLSAEQIRVAADLLQQGYQPGFIERYRADETGNLPRAALWLLKLEIDRQLRLQASRDRAASQLPKDAELDAEATKFLQRATTEVEIEAALRTFRSRRQLSQNQESDKQASSLLEKMIEYQGPPQEDLIAWSAEQLSAEPAVAEMALQHAGRLVSMLMHSDSNLNENLRRTIQRLAIVRVQLCDPAQAEAAEDASSDDSSVDLSAHTHDTEEDSLHEANNAEQPGSDHDSAEGATLSTLLSTSSGEGSGDEAVQELSGNAEAENSLVAEIGTDEATQAATVEELATDSVVEAAVTEPSESITVGSTDLGETDEQDPTEAASAEAASAEAASAELRFTSGDAKKGEKKLGKLAGKKKEAKGTKPAKKPVAKMTPRQRRRRWLVAMLQPMKSLKSPLTKLSSYQHLMLGRGRRSQLVKTELDYDRRKLVALARDTFVTEQHPLAAWFAQMAEEALEHSLRAKCEHDAVTDLEEIAADRLLVHSVDQLRKSLMQRPVRGHCILVVDAVGPKAAAIAVVSADGAVLAIDEIPSSASPGIVNQNVVRLGELVHQYRVSLVALTNGPARRFLVLSVRELMRQSAASGLRWTMAERSGADAYAVSRSALKELAAHNRRHRAAIWVGRSLQDPLAELLKVDVNRLRLGSYQRELPQEPLKQFVRETIADCLFSRGIDARKANADQLQCVSGVSAQQSQQIVAWGARSDAVSHSRKTLTESISGWSEQDQRQAIGLLRVFGSEQPLDGTLIHPDDYRLAERLVENTELTLPPAAPPDWRAPDFAPPANGKIELASETVETDQAGTIVVANNTDVTETADPNVQTETDVQVVAAEITSNAETASTSRAMDAAEAGEAAAVAGTAEATTESSEPTVAENSEAVVAEAPLAAWTDRSSSPQSTSTVTPEYPENELANAAPLPDSVDVEKLARGWQVGREKLRQVASSLHAPFADARNQNPSVPMMTEMPTLGNLQPGMCVWAVVIGVADFGAFVELAPECSGLIHISRLSAHFIEDPHQAVQVGDLVMAWVVSVDEKKNRVALTALSPDERAAAAEMEAERKMHREEHRQHGPGGQRAPGGQRGSGGQRSGGGAAQGTSTAATSAPGRSGYGQGAQGQSSQGQGSQQRGDSRGGGDGRRGAAGGSRSRGGQPGGQGGRGHGRPTHTKTVVVTSKKPKANITNAMKEGEEPLRSFSDLLQFYEAKRSDDSK